MKLTKILTSILLAFIFLISAIAAVKADAVVELQPQNPNNNVNILCAITNTGSYEPDDFFYKWFRNGNQINAVSDWGTETLPETYTNENDIIKCEVYRPSAQPPYIAPISADYYDSVTVQNIPPTIAVPDQTIYEDTTVGPQVDLQQYASDMNYFPDTGAQYLTYTLVSQGNPALINCQLTAGRYISCGAPTANQVGFSDIMVRVADTFGASSTGVFRINVLPVDDAAYWDALTDRTVPEDSADSTVVYQNIAFRCHDIDSTVAVTVTSAHPYYNLYINGNDLKIRAMEQDYFGGPETVGLSCNGIPASFQLTVTPVNDAPVVDLPASINFDEDTSISLNLDDYVTDVDNLDSEMTWSYTGNNHIHVAINANRVVTFTADADWNGQETITFTARDPGLLTGSDSVIVFVNPVNDAPVLTQNIPDQTWPEDTTLSNAFDLDNYFMDIDGDALAYSADTTQCIEITVLINANNEVTFIPDANFNGVRHVIFIASDVAAQTNSNLVRLTVTPVNDAPVANITMPADGSTFAAGSSIHFTGTGYDAEDGALTGNSLRWTSSIDGNFGIGNVVDISSLSVGTHIIVLTATDSDGAFGTDSITVTINETETEGVDVWANTYYQEVNQNVDAVYTIYVNNTGSQSKIFNLAANNINSADSVVLGSSTISLQPGETGTTTLQVRDANMGIYRATVTATASDNPTITDTTLVIITNVTSGTGNNTAPVANITMPADGSTFAAGSSIHFMGTGYDAEDGALTGNSLKWVSSINGNFGTGNAVNISTLSIGTHTITLTATDSQSATGTDSITITITKPAETGVKIWSDSYYKKVLENEEAVYTISVKNTGDRARTFMITTTNIDSARKVMINDFFLTLSPGETQTTKLRVIGGSIGTYGVTVTATADDNSSVTDTTKTIVTEVAEAVSDIEIWSDSYYKKVLENEEAVYTIFVKNTDSDDAIPLNLTFSLKVNNMNVADKADLDDYELLIAPGQTKTTKLHVKDASIGIYNVAVTATAAYNPKLTATTDIIVTNVTKAAGNNTAPVANITMPADGSTFAAGSSIHFAGTGYDAEDGALTGNSLRWTSSIDGNFGIGNVVDISSLSVGTHIIVLTATDSQSATGTDSITVTVKTASALVIDIFASPESGEPQLEVLFNAIIISGDGPFTYKWNFGDSTSPRTQQTVYHTYTEVGDYNVQLTVTDVHGNTATATKIIKVQYPPKKTENDPRSKVHINRLTIPNDDAIKPGETMNLIVNFENAGDYDMERTKITAIIDDLDVRKQIGPFNVDAHSETTKNIYLEIPEDAQPGIYMVRVTLHSEDRKEQIERVKYREFIVR